MIINEEQLGFDLDEETIKLLDAVIVNISTDEDIKDEFKKLRFIKSLGDNYKDTKGPIEQLLEKVAKIERDRFEANLDLRRVISDFKHLATIMQANLPPKEAKRLEEICGINGRSKFYTFND